ncbi:T6SS phospholipase effector Tle1-like catalytic domain-containing protein, partial [Thioalkalivibrio sp.]
MMRRIVVCADGTWNRPEEDVESDVPTNVLRLARAIAPADASGDPQQVFYDWGV